MADDTGYLRFPNLRGDQVTFAADDDVWVGSISAGRAWRLTADRVPVSRPRLSPDGATVAWISTRSGVAEAFAMPTTGGEPRQLTYFGFPTTVVDGFLPDGRLVVTSAGSQPFRSQFWAYALELEAPGDPVPVPLPFGPVNSVAVRGEQYPMVVGTGYQRDPAWWKRYRGGTAGRLWSAAAGSSEFGEILAELAGPKANPTWIGDRLAFLADFEGHGNVYSVHVDNDGSTSDLRRHTDHEAYYARQLTGDGDRLIYAHAGELWLIDDLSVGSQPSRLELEVPGARSGRAGSDLDASANIGEFAVDRTGRASAVEFRGSVVWLPHADGPARTVAGGAGVRHRCPVILDDNPAALVIAYASDASGPDAIEIASAGKDILRVGAGTVGRVLELVGSPDGSQLAAATHDGRLLLITVADGTIRELDRSDSGEPTGLTFSPDSAWLAYSAAEGSGARSIKLARCDTGVVTEVTTERFVDTEPAFSADGKYLLFLSARTFDPVYDAHVFDLSFPLATRPYLVTLAAATPTPFGPELAGRAPAGATAATAASSPVPARTPTTDGAAADNTAADTAAEAPAATVVDLDGLANRVVPFPVPAGLLSDLHAVRGGAVWSEAPIAGELGESRLPDTDVRPSVQRWDFASRKQVQLLAHADELAVSGDGSVLVVRDHESLLAYPADRPADKEKEPDAVVAITLDRVQLRLDPPAEWRQMLDETARLMAEHFWMDDLGGIDWDAVTVKYRALIGRISTRDDLSDVLWELNGELGSSHAYETPPPRPVPARSKPAYLGADLSVDERGRTVIGRILAGDNSARDARSPLTAPGVDLASGDVVVAVNGRPLSARGLPAELRGTADQPVSLTVLRDGEQHDTVVVPLPSDAGLRYLDWVAQRREIVRAATGGRVGYVHVPDMMSAGWAAFHRDLRTQLRRDALIVDTRYNGGGHTSQLVIEKLARTVIGWDVARYRPDASYPEDAPRGPLISIANEWSGSDGDIVNAAFSEMQLGPVLGTRTWGGVVGIDGRYKLVDGTAVTQPRYSFWFANRGWSVENHGVDPDLVVEFLPQDWAAGADPQLQAAIDWITAELERRPAPGQPDLVNLPRLAAPPLPPRS